jgi:hypothetical protein
MQRANTRPILYIVPEWKWRTRVTESEYKAAAEEAYAYLLPYANEDSMWGTSWMMLARQRPGLKFDVAEMDTHQVKIGVEIAVRIAVPCVLAIILHSAFIHYLVLDLVINRPTARRALRRLRLHRDFARPGVVVSFLLIMILIDFIPPLVSPYTMKPTDIDKGVTTRHVTSFQDFV